MLIHGEGLNIAGVVQVARHKTPVGLSAEAMTRVASARSFVESLVADGRVAYGVTTGFGKFSEVSISQDATAELQRNLIRSHACGVGAPFDEEHG
jgi:histidine ammonia-lyase